MRRLWQDDGRRFTAGAALSIAIHRLFSATF
jgi:hypothetical protein